MKKHLCFWFAVLAILFVGCKQPNTADKPNTGDTNKPNPSPPPPPAEQNFNIQVKFDGEFIDIAELITADGIPYTAAYPYNTDATVTAKDSKYAGKTITAQIIEPKEKPDSVLVFTKKTDGTFSFQLKETNAPQKAKIRFSIEGTSVTQDLAFTIQPKPEVTGIKNTPESYLLGKDVSFKLEPELICKPEKFGAIKAEKFLSSSAKTITYASSDSEVVTLTDYGRLETKKAGKATLTLTTANGQTCTIPVEVQDQKAPTYGSVSPERINLSPGGQKTVSVYLSPDGANTEITEWQNSNPEVGSITPAGTAGKYVITARAAGTAEFTAFAKYNQGVKLSVTLTVTDTAIENITIEPSILPLKAGESKKLTALITPTGAPNTVTWLTYDSKIIKLEQDGTVTALKDGKATVYVESTVDAKKTARCEVIVSKPVESISLDKTVAELTYGETLTLTPTILPTAAFQEVTWSADESDLLRLYPSYSDATAQISARYKTGKAAVTATAKADPSKKAECTVYVAKNKVSSVSVDTHSFTLAPNKTERITITVTPADAALDIGYNIEGDNLTVSNLQQKTYPKNEYDCIIKTGEAETTQKITFFSKANPEKKAAVTVTVKTPPVESITVANKTISTKQTTEKMTAEVQPAGAVQTVTWESGHPDIVKIDKTTGVLTPVKAGTATVTATSTADASRKASAAVTVVAALESFTAALTDTTVYYGHDAVLTVTPVPAGAFGDFKVTSGNPDIRITPVEGEANKFTVSTGGKNVKDGTAVITVTSGADPSLHAQTITVTTKDAAPKSLEIHCSNADFKMYKKESVQLSVTAEGGAAANPYTNTSVTWKMTSYDNDYASITEDGSLTLTNTGKAQRNGKIITVIAVSKPDPSITAEKKITIYDNIAEIESVSCTIPNAANAEYVLGSLRLPKVKLTFSQENNYYPYFIITEKSEPDASSDYLEKIRYKYESYLGEQIKPKRNTEGKPVQFYVFPVDPKTEKPVTTGFLKKFALTVWEQPTGLSITHNGTECAKNFAGNYVFAISQDSSSTGWSVQTIPEFSKPSEVTVSIRGDSNIDGNTYTYLSDKKYENGKNTFTLKTFSIGLFYGDRSNTITFTSKDNESLTQKLSVTVKK